jgi:hypothetical protein
VNFGISAGISATVMVIVQPWLTLAVDQSHAPRSRRSSTRCTRSDAALMGVPNVDIGLAVGASLPLRFGIGAVFGPIDKPNDLARWGVGLSGGVTRASDRLGCPASSSPSCDIPRCSCS